MHEQVEYKGHTVAVDVIPRGRRWDWAYSIDGSGYFENSEELAPTDRIARSEAIEAARRRIDAMGG